MATIRTTFQNLTQFQDALTTAGPAGTAMDNVITQTHNSFADFGFATLLVNFASPTAASGNIAGGGSFSVNGSGILSPSKSITRLSYSDNNPDAFIQLQGSMTASGPSPTFITSFGGTVREIDYSGSAGIADFAGSITTNRLLTGNLVYSATRLDLQTGSTDLSLRGSISANNGTYSGSVTSFGIEDFGSGHYLNATGLTNLSFAELNGNVAGTIIQEMLAGNDTIIGEGTDQTLDGYGGNDSIVAGTGADTLDGGAGNDTLDGGAGIDSLAGGLGNDFYVYDGTADEFVEEAGDGTGTDTVLASATYVLAAANIETVTLVGTGAIGATGNGDANVLTGNAGDNLLEGLAGNDTLNGGAGNDTLIGGAGQDSVLGGLGNDQVRILVTDGDVDFADGGALSSDTLVLIGTVDGDEVVVVNLASTTDQVTRIGDADPESLVQKNFENVDGFGLGSSLNATGSAGANLIAGSAGDDSLAGALGNDTLIGHAGVDTLGGGAGADHQLGGAGNDVVIVASTADYAGDNINGGNGFDVLYFTSAAATTLMVNATTRVEQLVVSTVVGDFSGSAAINVNASAAATGLEIMGNAGNNVITGSAFSDNLRGLGGDDIFLIGAGSHHTDEESIDGDAGINTIRFTRAAATDNVLTLSAFIQNINKVEAVGTAALSIDASDAPGFDGFEIKGNTGANALTGTAENDVINGDAGNDTLNGGSGQDTLSGGLGNDRIITQVGSGTDVADGKEGIDTLVLTDGEGLAVVVNLAAGAGDQLTLINGVSDDQLQNNFENLDASDGTIGTVDVTGSAGANLLFGSNGNDTMSGGAGNDFLGGGAGADTLSGEDGNDMLGGGSGDDSLSGGAGIDTLEGGAGVDSIDGGDGNDVILILNGGEHGEFDPLDGGAGTLDVIRLVDGTNNDEFYLGASVVGIERVVIGTVTGVITGTNNNTVDATNVGNALTIIGSNGVNAIFGTEAGNDTIVGNGGDDDLNGAAENDSLSGGAGNDTLSGGAGNDTLVGGLGNDLYTDFTPGSDVLREDSIGGSGTDTVQTLSSGYTLGANLENLLLLSAEGVSGFGNSLHNSITATSTLGNRLEGNAGNDTLDGGGGHDTLVGGAGNDRIVVSVTDASVDDANGGTADIDTLALAGDEADGQVNVDLLSSDQLAAVGESGLDVTMQQNFDYVDASGLGAASYIHASGNNSANLLIGSNNSATGDVLGGLGGNDTLVGGDGGDALNGGTENDSLAGGEGTDTIAGGTGNDTLFGGAGDDSLQGGDGNDFFLLGAASEHSISEIMDGGAGTDTLLFSPTADDSLLLNSAAVERVIITGSAGDVGVNASNAGGLLSVTGNGGANDLTGNDLGNTLSSSAGNDVLTGGGGTDTLIGGLGDDRYQLGSGDINDTLTELAGQGTDEVAFNNSYGGLTEDLIYTLRPNVENASITNLGDHAGTLTGNSLANLLLGNGEGDGTFFFNGGDGNDTLTTDGNDNPDTLIGGAGNDTLNAGIGADSVDGGLGNDHVTMIAQQGYSDIANGGDGVDTLTLVGGEGSPVVTVLLWVAVNTDQVSFANDDGLLQRNFENVDASGLSGTLVADGSTGANSLVGALGNDTLNGLAGNDTLVGGGGNDSMSGGAGNDSLHGGAGADSMTGGAGNDTYVLDNAGDQVTEAPGLSGGTDKIIHESVQDSYTLADHVENLEVLLFVGAEGVSATGNVLGNVIVDKSGVSNTVSLIGLGGNDSLAGTGTSNNFLDGGAGKDTLRGGAGDDLYNWSIATDLTDVLIEAANQGTDKVQLLGDGIKNLSFTLQANFENADIFNMGSMLATVTGNTLNNVLSSFSERAFLNGGAGNDTLRSVIVGSGNDTLLGGAGNDTLTGGNGADSMMGGDGDDRFLLDLVGELAAGERMDGGTGTDTLQLTFQAQSLDLTTIANSSFTGIEVVDITGTGNNFLTLALGDVLDFSATTNTLRVDGNANDVVNSLGQGWALDDGGPVTIGANQYNSYTSGLGTLLIDTDITQNNVN